MRAGLMPALTVILALAAAPLQAETAPGAATGTTGPKFVKPEATAVDTATGETTTGEATAADTTAPEALPAEPAVVDTAAVEAVSIDPSGTASTLAEQILSAATLPEDAAEDAVAAEATATDAPPAEPAATPSIEAVLAVATSGVNRALDSIEELKRETIEVRVSISQQMMEVWYNGEMIHEWPVSTARKGKVTPKGSFKPQWLSKNHKSSLYNNAPMPYSIFYSGNYAIHGTDQESKLGRPASAGCVRLSRANAKILFAMVQQEGKSKMKVEILD